MSAMLKSARNRSQLVEQCNNCQSCNDINHCQHNGNSCQNGIVSSALSLSEQLLCTACNRTGQTGAVAGLQKNCNNHQHTYNQKNRHKHGMHIQNPLQHYVLAKKLLMYTNIILNACQQ